MSKENIAANKAEVEPVAWMNPNETIISNAFQGWKDKHHTSPVYVTPPATTGASTALRPTDDELWDATLRDRDAYHDWADKLADAIANYFGVDIGEHSNQNLPWDEALQAIENAEPVGASTVLTDERIDAIMAKYSAFIAPGVYSLYSFECVEDVRSFAREVAAQAGQVAVPDDLARDAARFRWLEERFTGFDFYWMGTPPYEAEEDKGKCVIVFECGQDFEAGRHFQREIDKKIGLAAAPSPAKESK